MATYLIDLSPQDMRRRLGEALSVYVDAMRYPRGTEDNRASMWLEHTKRSGWKAVAAVAPSDTADGADPSALADAPCSASPTATAGHPISGGSSRWSRACTGPACPTPRSVA